MNERIKLLAEQAKLPSYVLEYGTELCLAPHLEKFAELIAQDIADQFKHVFTDEQYQRRIDKEILKRYGIID